MKQKWQSINKKVAEFSLRERVMILMAGLVILYYPAYSLLLSQWWHTTQITSTLITNNKKQIAATQDLIETIQFELKKDPNEKLQNQRMLLLQQLKDKNDEFREKAAELVSPELMADLLKRVLKSSQGLKLVALSSISPQVLLTLNEGNEASEQTTLYSHGVKLQLIGGYFDIVHFLQALEQLPENFYWKELQYQVLEYPTANLAFEIYTLSTKKEFIGG